MPKFFSWKDGADVTCPSDLDYDDTAVCDVCGEYKTGRMLHTAGRTGRVCPVLFLCRECSRKRHDIGE